MKSLAEIVEHSEEVKPKLAFEKPKKSDRRRVAFDTSDLAIPKHHYAVDARYRAYIREHRCILHTLGKCEGAVEAAHMQRGGRGIKGSDYSCVPLCGKRHHPLLDGNSLDHEVEKFLWMKAWEFYAEWVRMEAK